MTTLDVLFCTDYLPPSDGGVEHVVDQLARRLCDRGYDVGVFTLSGDDETIALRDHPEIAVFTANKIELTEYIGLQSAVAPAAVREFKHVVEQTNPDVVHAHNRFFFTSFVALVYKYHFEYPLVTSLHLGELTHLDGFGGHAANLFQTVLSRQLVARSDAVLCVSNAVGEVAIELGAAPQRTTVVPNAVNLEQFSVPEPSFDKTLLYVGRLIRNNGPQDLLEAVPDIFAAHPDATVHIVGSGTLQSELETRAGTLGVDGGVEIHGFVDDVTDWYPQADIFCRPSYSEGLPLTLLEAMATHSTPVVTPVAGSSEIVNDGVTGRFVPVGDSDAIAKTVNDLFARPEQTAKIAESARTFVENNHSWEHRTETIISVYEQVETG